MGRFRAYVVWFFFAIVYLYPFLIQIVTSFKTDTDATNTPLSLLPDP